MDEKTYSVHLHRTPYKSKPPEHVIPSINKTITQQSTAVTQRQFAELVGKNGRTTVLGLMNGARSKKNMTSQEVVAIDFDNTKMVNDKKVKTTGSEYTSIDDILDDEYAQQNASFIYKTFSHQEDWHHFRVVFFLDYKLTKNKQVELLYKWLMKKYPNADKANKDSSRLFFGGTDVIEIRFGNELDTSKVEVEPKDVQQPATPPGMINSKVKKIKHEDAQVVFKEYLEREKVHLQDYDNALSAIWALGKAAKTGEISYPSAYQFVEDLAMGNTEWAENNKRKLEECLNQPIHEIRTNYTFAQKFGYQFDHSDIDRGDIIQTSKYLVDQLQIKLFNGQLYFKTDNHWINDDNKLLRAVDQYVELKSAQDNELMKQFEKRAELIEKEIFPIQFRNNYVFKDGQVYPYNSEEFTPYFLDVNYDPTAYNKHVDEFLDFLTCDRKDLRQVIEDMLGHVLMMQGFPHKVFFFIGEKGGNGKSTFLEMLNNFAGDLATNISLDNFNDPTSVVDLEGRLVNIGDDIDASFLDKSSNFKILASGNTLKVRPIYATPYSLKNKATLIFTANEMPSFKDKSGGITRRLIIIPCDNVVKKQDLTIDSKLSTDEAKSYILNLALSGLNNIRENGGKISKSKTIESNVLGYLVDNNSVLLYLKEGDIDLNTDANFIYNDYRQFADDYGFKPFSKTKFTQILKDEGYEKVRKMRLGKRQFYYEKVEDEED